MYACMCVCMSVRVHAWARVLYMYVRVCAGPWGVNSRSLSLCLEGASALKWSEPPQAALP